MIYILAGAVVAYLIGSFPTAFVLCRLFKGIDIREHGSGNVGATNVFRTAGKGLGAVVFVIDFLKGTIAVTLIPFVIHKLFPAARPWGESAFLILGAAAISGHIWTIFLKFKGGKGVATTAGVMGGLAPFIFFGGLAIWAGVFYFSRYVSLASIAAAAALPILSLITGKDIYFTLFAVILCVVGIYSHRANIKRLMNGTEKKIL